MHNHQLLDHPLFEERPIKETLEPFGFEVSVEFQELPCPIEQPEEADAFGRDSMAYIDSLTFQHPAAFTEIYRGDNEDSEIFSVAVRAKTVFAQLLLCADSAFAGRESALNPSYLAVYHERMRQLSTEGFSRERDDEYQHAELAYAAASYAYQAANTCTDNAPAIWPWDRKWWKPSDPRRNLVKAGALILAEIERLDRAAARQGGAA
ncbi:hypothetical protein LY622_13720 [Halomonas sp. M5N1S17]|uniref:hypothetical protein n=1 Tax=Halomonas alkalisoli TaxID=2907158 RepID=UPI001F29F4A1|nr:hypothetical protein [Halomonas alkalisoli]MCE9664492.1 hypothetical protein [Halomonas alkalisoli]